MNIRKNVGRILGTAKDVMSTAFGTEEGPPQTRPRTRSQPRRSKSETEATMFSPPPPLETSKSSEESEVELKTPEKPFSTVKRRKRSKKKKTPGIPTTLEPLSPLVGEVPLESPGTRGAYTHNRPKTPHVVAIEKKQPPLKTLTKVMFASTMQKPRDEYKKMLQGFFNEMAISNYNEIPAQMLQDYKALANPVTDKTSDAFHTSLMGLFDKYRLEIGRIKHPVPTALERTIALKGLKKLPKKRGPKKPKKVTKRKRRPKGAKKKLGGVELIS